MSKNARAAIRDYWQDPLDTANHRIAIGDVRFRLSRTPEDLIGPRMLDGCVDHVWVVSIERVRMGVISWNAANTRENWMSFFQSGNVCCGAQALQDVSNFMTWVQLARSKAVYGLYKQ